MYSTVFSPSVYPMNPAWLTGKMPEAWYKYEHSEDPTAEPVKPRIDEKKGTEAS